MFAELLNTISKTCIHHLQQQQQQYLSHQKNGGSFSFIPAATLLDKNPHFPKMSLKDDIQDSLKPAVPICSVSVPSWAARAGATQRHGRQSFCDVKQVPLIKRDLNHVTQTLCDVPPSRLSGWWTATVIGSWIPDSCPHSAANSAAPGSFACPCWHCRL